VPDLDEKVYALDTRVSHVETNIATMVVEQSHHAARMDMMDKQVLDHMAQEEIDRKATDTKLDGLLKYKWILFGMAFMMWITTGENQILQLFKMAG